MTTGQPGTTTPMLPDLSINSGGWVIDLAPVAPSTSPYTSPRHLEPRDGVKELQAPLSRGLL